ncbi:Glutathione-regulated potassium-efflux system protein kefB [Dorcoceras hygrometricum]|uniref:Glutathione-regulated potassium-efflux system protein kefB n=1 Tax=Dorcoceras hygrometricum TaxID=472368 RepID=A0A2Z7CLW4_9LAMI|nr:Glutathione-regulated potassium-efflux system protein kefB [Dorcoceras hygrometricum]
MLILGEDDDIVKDQSAEIVDSETIVGGTTAEQPAAEVELASVEDQPAADAATGVQETEVETEDDSIHDETVVESIFEPAVVATTDDADTMIEQVLDQLALITATQDDDEAVEGDQDIGPSDVGEHTADKADESENWFTLAYEKFYGRKIDEPAATSSDTDEEFIADKPTDQLFPDEGDQPHGSETVAEEITTNDELLSIEEHLAQIPSNASLPSALAPNITQITFGQGIEFREVDAYKASLPQIAASDKGKVILVEDHVQGHPAREIFSLICADIEFLVQLREKVIEDVSVFVSSFSIRRLATLQSEDIYAKEGKILSWAETESSFVAIQRRMLIIAKYRELLLQKFIEARRRNFVSGTPTSAIDLKVLNLLIASHHFALKELLRHMREHQLEWTRPSSSSLFEGANIDRGFFIPHNHRSIFSKCWIRSKIMVDGSWLILEGVDYWRPITNPVNSKNWEALPQRPYIDDLAPLCVLIEPVQDVESRAPMSRAIHILWGEICVEVIQFSLLRSLLPVGSVNICRNIVVHSSVVDVLEKLPNNFCSIVQQGIDSNNFVGYFSHSDVQSIAENDLVSSDGSTVYHSPSPQHDCFQSFNEAESEQPSVHIKSSSVPSISVSDPVVQIDFVQRPDSPTHTDSPMHFNADDISLDSTPDNQLLLAVGPTEFSTSLADLQTLLSECIDESQSGILSKLHTIERGLRDSLLQQDEAYRTLIQGARLEGRTIDDVQTLRFNEFRKSVLANSASVTADFLDVKKAVRELNAKVDAVATGLVDVRKDLEDTKESISHQLLEGGNERKGEGSSRGPQPPPDDQNRGSGNTGGGGDNVRTTSIVDRLIDADRRRERGSESSSRGNRSGSYKRRR